jgi:hypothetical protein
MVVPDLIAAAAKSAFDYVDGEFDPEAEDFLFAAAEEQADGSQRTRVMRTSAVEEKSTACRMILVLAQDVKEHFAPYVEEAVNLFETLLDGECYFEDIRAACMQAMPVLMLCFARATAVGVGGTAAPGYAERVTPVLAKVRRSPLFFLFFARSVCFPYSFVCSLFFLFHRSVLAKIVAILGNALQAEDDEVGLIVVGAQSLKLALKRAADPGESGELADASAVAGQVFLDDDTVGGLLEVSVLLCTVTYYANRAHNLTRSP